MIKIIKNILFIFLTLFSVSYILLMVYAYLPYEEIPINELAESEDRFIIIEENQMRYRVFGEQNNPNIVLIHGFGNSINTWRKIVPDLKQHYRVIALDLLGFGLSDKPVQYDYSNKNQARTISLFAEAIDLDQYIIGGHSLGGAIAVHVALNDLKTTGLVLFNPGIITTGVPEFSRYLNLIFPFARVTAKQFSKREFREQFLKNSFIDTSIVTDEVMDSIMLGTKTEGYMDGTTSMMSKFYVANEKELLPDIDIPTLIIFGQEDRTKSLEEAITLNQNIKGSKLALIEKVGHYVHEEAPFSVSKNIINESQFLSTKGHRYRND